MPSLREPKRIALLTADGRAVPFLAKAGEDLRLDARVERLFGAANGALAAAPATLARRLAVPT
jgi:phosphatidylinositol kinase/protein kinase (PI-3  family)